MRICREAGLLWRPVIDRAASRLGQGDAADPQFYEDIDQVTFDASSPGNQAIQCAPQPAGPSGDVLPETTDVVSLLDSRQMTEGFRHKPIV